MIIGVLLIPVSEGLDADLSVQGARPYAIRWIAAFLVLVAYWIAFVVLPRCRDLHLSRWEMVLVFIPPVGLPLWARLAWGRSRPFLDSPVEQGPPGDYRSEPPQPAPIAQAATPNRIDALRRLEKLRDEGTLTEEQFQRMKSHHGL
jgi:hypothetical protein